jgi:Transposase DNA-binding/Transposase DDE domain
MRTLRGMFDLKDIIMAAPLGDVRRNKRALEIVTNLVQGEGTGTADHVHAPGSASAWAHTMGSSRFYDNEDVLLPNLYEASRKALATLVPPGHRAYVIYDVSPVDYSHHEAKDDRIQVGNKYGKGYVLFSALVLDEQGRPLGPVMQELQTAHGCLSSEGFQPFPFVDHYEQVERGIRAARLHLPDRDLVGVMDREFDDLALQRWLGDILEKYVIRALQLDRKVLLHGRPTTLRNAVHAARRVVAGELERDGKVYEVRLAETRVTFHGPSWRGHKHGRPPQKGPPLPVRVVVVELYRHGHRAHQWVLLTNLDEPAEKIAKIYTWRWRVERLFYLLKVGIRMPRWEEQTGERIARRLALASLAATLIYQLQQPPPDPLKLALTRKIATIGGWLGRKCDPIGPLVLMRGMLRLLEAIELLETHGADALRALGEELAHALGLPVPGVGPPLRRPRRPHRHAHRSPAGP